MTRTTGTYAISTLAESVSAFVPYQRCIELLQR